MLFKYNILLGVDDRGHISCHKINLCFVYFDVSYCIVRELFLNPIFVLQLFQNVLQLFQNVLQKFLKDMLENESQPTDAIQTTVPSTMSSIMSRMDINTSDIVITGSEPKSLSQKEVYFV